MRRTVGLLRARGERPKKRRHGRRPAEHSDELSAFHSGRLDFEFVMRGLDPRIHLLTKKDGLPGQARQ